MLGVRSSERAAAAKLCRSATSRKTRMRSICPVIALSSYSNKQTAQLSISLPLSVMPGLVQACPGRPRASACERCEGFADRARTVRESVEWLNHVDGRDKTGHDAQVCNNSGDLSSLYCNFCNKQSRRRRLLPTASSGYLVRHGAAPHRAAPPIEDISHAQDKSDQRLASRHFVGRGSPGQQCVLHQSARAPPRQKDGELRRSRRLSSLLRRRGRNARLGDDLFPVPEYRSLTSRHGRGRRNCLLRAQRLAAVLDGAVRLARHRRPEG